MSALYPTSLPAAGSAITTSTLAAAGHTALHNNLADEARAIATKVGTGAATPASGQVLRSSGVGTSTWGSVVLTTDVTGVLPVGSGGTGTNSTTGSGSVVYGTSPTIATPSISNPTITGGGSWAGSPTISSPTISSPSITSGGSWVGSPVFTTPVISDLSQAQHNHTSDITGGSLFTTSWIAPTFVNSWENYDNVFNSAGYCKDVMGFVHLRGLVRNGTDGSTIFTLPTGYRPERRELLVCSSVDHYGRLDIPTDGQVIPQLTTTEPGWVCLDGITFKAYQ